MSYNGPETNHSSKVCQSCRNFWTNNAILKHFSPFYDWKHHLKVFGLGGVVRKSVLALFVGHIDNRPQSTSCTTLSIFFFFIRIFLTCDIWHVTRDKWHVTCDTWREVNIISKFQVPSSYGLWARCLKVISTKDERLKWLKWLKWQGFFVCHHIMQLITNHG